MNNAEDAPPREYDTELCEGSGIELRHVIGSPAWSVGPAGLRCFERGAGPSALRAVNEHGDVLSLDARDGGLRRRVRLPAPYAGEARTGASVAGVIDAVISPDGALVAMQLRARRYALFDAETLEPRADFTGDPRIAGRYYTLGPFSRDGALFAATSPLSGGPREPAARTLLWTAAGEPAGMLDGGGCLAWADDGDVFVAREGRDGGCVARVGRDGATRWVSLESPLVGLALECSIDGALVFATGARPMPGASSSSAQYQSFLRAHDAKTGALRWQLVSLERAEAMRAGPRGGVLWVLGRDGMRAVEPASGEPLAELSWADPSGARRAGSRFAVSADERTLYVPIGPRVVRFDAQTGDELADESEARGPLIAVGLAPSGARVASVDLSRTVRVHSAQTGDEVWSLDAPTTAKLALAFAPDERSLYAFTSTGATVFDLEGGLASQALSLVERTQGAARSSAAANALSLVRRVAIAPDGSSVYAAGDGQHVSVSALNLRSLATGGLVRSVRLPGTPQALLDVRPNPDGGSVFVTLADGTVLAIDGATLAVENLGLVEGAGTAALANARFVARDRSSAWALVPGGAGSAPTLALYVKGAVAQRFEAPAAYGTPAAHLDASRDGRWVLTGSPAGDALVWRVATDEAGVWARCVARVALSLAHDRLVSSAFDARGETLALGTERGVLVVCALAQP